MSWNKRNNILYLGDTSFLLTSDLFDTILLVYHGCQDSNICTNCSHGN